MTKMDSELDRRRSRTVHTLIHGPRREKSIDVDRALLSVAIDPRHCLDVVAFPIPSLISRRNRWPQEILNDDPTHDGFQSESNNTSREAPIMLRPVPPALELKRKTTAPISTAEEVKEVVSNVRTLILLRNSIKLVYYLVPLGIGQTPVEHSQQMEGPNDPYLECVPVKPAIRVTPRLAQFLQDIQSLRRIGDDNHLFVGLVFERL
jgi:hypothetical protein